MKTFFVRTASAAVYVLLFGGSIYSGRLLGNNNVGVIILAAFLLFVGIGCTFEFFRMVASQHARPNKFLGYFGVLMMQVVLPLLAIEGNVVGRFVAFCYFLLFLMVFFAVVVIVQLWRPSEHPFGDIAHTVVPLFYVALPLSLMPILNTEMNVLMIVVILEWVNDCFAYMGGSLLGRHKLWQRHSPGKTWEGFLCGMLFCMAVALFVGPWFTPKLLWYDWLVLGFICSVIGTLGDLAESMLKRSVGVKDSGSIMPGHGGFLDRFDSLLVVIPFVFVYLTLSHPVL